MDFSLSNEQRNWQMTARKFAEEEIKPITLDLDEAPDAHGTFDWDIVEKGSQARLPHAWRCRRNTAAKAPTT